MILGCARNSEIRIFFVYKQKGRKLNINAHMKTDECFQEGNMGYISMNRQIIGSSPEGLPNIISKSWQLSHSQYFIWRRSCLYDLSLQSNIKLFFIRHHGIKTPIFPLYWFSLLFIIFFFFFNLFLLETFYVKMTNIICRWYLTCSHGISQLQSCILQ